MKLFVDCIARNSPLWHISCEVRKAAALTESFLDNGERGYRRGAVICAANHPKTGDPEFP
jgi:hypothetical protein